MWLEEYDDTVNLKPTFRPAPLGPRVARAIDDGRSAKHWIARLGVAGFTFFLVKGLLWLAVPAIIAWAR